MNYVALVIMAVGVYLVDSAIKNRDPIGFLTALLSSDSPNLAKTLEEYDGKWFTPLGEVAGASNVSPASSPNEQGLGTSNNPRNGRLTDNELTKLSWNNKKVANGAAQSLEELNREYRKEFGTSLAVTDGYRSYAQQVAVKAAKGFLAATPGQSNHGEGLAVDLGGGINSFGTRQYEWMMKNGPRFGWVNPSWAQQGGKKPEPWHWEFVGGKAVTV